MCVSVRSSSSSPERARLSPFLSFTTKRSVASMADKTDPQSDDLPPTRVDGSRSPSKIASSLSDANDSQDLSEVETPSHRQETGQPANQWYQRTDSHGYLNNIYSGKNHTIEHGEGGDGEGDRAMEPIVAWALAHRWKL